MEYAERNNMIPYIIIAICACLPPFLNRVYVANKRMEEMAAFARYYHNHQAYRERVREALNRINERPREPHE